MVQVVATAVVVVDAVDVYVPSSMVQDLSKDTLEDSRPDKIVLLFSRSITVLSRGHSHPQQPGGTLPPPSPFH